MEWLRRLRTEQLDIPLFEISGTTVTLATLAAFVIIVLVTFWTAGLAQRAVARAFSRKGQGEEGTAGVASRLVRYAVLVVGLAVAINSLGINLNALFAAGAVFAVAIGFAMQAITQNFVSGVILLLERVIKPGDVIEVDGQFVRVRDMGIRATVARTLDDEDIIVPNSSMVSSAVKNYTFSDSSYRLRCVVGVVYSADMAEVRRVLEATAGELDWRSGDREPRILMTSFGDSSVNFEVSVWIDEPWHRARRLSDLHEAVWWALKRADITIAFPQVDVHFDPPVVESLAAMRTAG